ncbi:hypothetical protein [uncultured Dokdonia sp.]|uniref:hypothetical protein n=1 Tax=uncultured Dokdonia sp. TaxID=575653 RepID=UPI002620CB5D|nr:hypothetical protein [uncultured Dokdonia sp.]
MLKKISNINGAQELNNKDQKSIKGGFGFPGFEPNCCACTFFPAGSPYMVFITQSCDEPCPQNGATEYQDTGC